MKYHASYIEPCVHMKNFACRTRCVVAGQKQGGAANLIWCHCSPQGSFSDGFVDQFVEMFDSRRRPRPYGTSRNSVDTDRFWAKFVRKITHR